MLSLISPLSRIPYYLIHRIYPSSNYIFSKYFVSFTTNTVMDTNNSLVGREIDLLEAKDIRFRLPGNVGIFINDNWLLKFKDLNDSRNTNYNKQKNHFMSISHEELLNKLNDDKPMPNTQSFFYEDKKNLHCEAHECPLLLVKDFQELFPKNNVNLSNGLTVLTIAHKTENDMSIWSKEVDCEREKLLEKFVLTAEKICSYLKDNGYWADFIDPSSGRPYYGEYTPATFFETDERYRRFGFEIEDLGCCKVVSHKRWGTNAFIGALFTNASHNSEIVQRLVISLD